jgi:hypothetical protein
MAKHLTPPLSVAPIPARRWKPFSTPCQAQGHDSKDFQVHAQPRFPQFDHITLYIIIIDFHGVSPKRTGTSSGSSFVFGTL